MTLWLLKQLLFASGLLKNVFAAYGSTGGNITLYNPLGTSDFTAVVDKVANFLITIGVPIAAVMVLVGGFQMLVSSGNPERVSSGKKTILYAAIGLVVILAAKSIVVLIKNILGA